MVNEISSEFSSENLKSRREESILSAGALLFLERGIENVKMTDIAEQSGVGVATLYRYYGTKTTVAVEVMTYLWNDLRELFGGMFDSEIFLSQTGIKQLTDLMRMFVVLYEAHKDFMKLLGEFDSYVIRENVPKDELVRYEGSVIDFYPVLERAYKKGCDDGTVRSCIDFGLFYKTYTHALMEMCKKFINGAVLPSEDFSDAEKELEMMIDTAVYYLRA